MNLTRTFVDTAGEERYWGTLANGLQVHIQPKRGFRRKYATFSTRYGSIDNEFVPPGESEIIKVPDGIAHFLEHKLFEEEDGSVDRQFSALGASCNAYTSFTKTTYLFSTVQRFDECLKLLVGFVGRPHFTHESVEKEKGIIGQEIKMYEDSPQWRVFFNLLNAMFPEHPVRIDIGGSVESIAQIKPDDLYLCYRTFYHPSNMLLYVLGDVDPAQVADIVERQSMADFPDPQPESIRRYPGENGTRRNLHVEERLAVAVPLLAMGFRDSSRAVGRELLKREIMMDLLLEATVGQASPLYNRLYRQGLLNDTFDAEHTSELSFGYTRLGGETSNPEALKEGLLEGFDEIRRRGLERSQFERARRKLLGEYIRGLNSMNHTAESFTCWAFRGADFFDVYGILGELSHEEGQSVLNEHFSPENAVSSFVLPQDPG